MSPSHSPQELAPTTIKNHLLSTLTFIVFVFLDFLDCFLCIVYKYLDKFFEGNAFSSSSSSCSCYCQSRSVVAGNGANEGKEEGEGEGEDSSVHDEVSDTLYRRRNVFREFGFFGSKRNVVASWKKPPVYGGGAGSGGGGREVVRWSDCGCESCVSWISKDEMKLHVVVQEPPRDDDKSDVEPIENVIFIHGFLSSSSCWTEIVFPYFSESIKHHYRLFGVDLLGFGRSPKPRNCLYTIKDHIEMIEKSLVEPYGLKSFHLVAHSMGCIIALAMAAKHPQCVKSITLVAPSYVESTNKKEASLEALEKLAKKRLWPPLSFGSSFMSWYEHLGRCVCFFLCRNHRIWERILRLFTQNRGVHLLFEDLTRHTHHSAWHTMHNVICGGAKVMDRFLETLVDHNVKIFVIQGDRDLVVPIECSYNLVKMVLHAKFSIVSNADHTSIIFSRKKDFAKSLEHFWVSIVEKS